MLFYFSFPFLSVYSFCLCIVMHIGQSTVDLTKVDGLKNGLMSSNVLGVFEMVKLSLYPLAKHVSWCIGYFDKATIVATG